MIAIVDYGLGNVEAIATIYRRLDIPVCVASSVQGIAEADRIVLPGVGAFDRAMTRLNDSGVRAALEDAAVVKHKPILGICIGMQMMASGSDEGSMPGLGWIEGRVKRFDFDSDVPALPLPHMGWNDVKPRRNDDLFRGLDSGARFYFLHSYFFAAANDENVLALTEYNSSYASSVNAGNVFGVQFHPEKSHQWGVQLLRNFAEM